MDLRPYNFAGPGSSTKADLYTTGSKRPFTTSDIVVNGTGDTFAIEHVTEPTLKVGSGDLLYIIPVTFNILREQLYTTRIIIPL